MNSLTNTIHWCSPTYDAIRRNFHKKQREYESIRKLFNDELELFGGKIVDDEKSNLYMTVVDSLGMNNYKGIVFSSEENMLMFIMKWS